MSTTAQHTATLPAVYSEHGPVWVAQIYETHDECAPCSHMTWRVEDLDGHIIALDMTEPYARTVAKTLNLFPGLVEALEACVANMEGFTQRSAGKPSAIREARDILARVKDGDLGNAVG